MNYVQPGNIETNLYFQVSLITFVPADGPVKIHVPNFNKVYLILSFAIHGVFLE